MDFILEKPLIEDEVHAGAIHVYHNVWDDIPELIDSVEKEAKNPDSGLFFDKAMTVGGQWDGPRQNLIMPISECGRRGNQLAARVHNRFGMTLDRALQGYSKKFDAPYTFHEFYSLLKYRGANEEHYDAHFDGTTQSGRSISAVFYLNDDYEGGEVEFVNYGVKIKPKAGSLILFPSNYAYSHIAHKVTKGTKYAIVTWVHDH
jgi:predicted 2-oxoglutarate/Fe(II)-dependent dioxygenase YbiX